MRHRLTVGVAMGLCLAVMSTTAHAGDLDRTRSRLQETESGLDRAREGLEIVTGQVAMARDQLAEADRKLNALVADLQRREEELRAAEAEYAAAVARTEEATAELREVTARLEATQEDLAVREVRFENRVVAAYKYGNVSYAEALIGAEDVADFVNTMYYVRSVMDTEQGMIGEVAATARAVADDRAQVDALRERLTQDQAAADKLRDQVEVAASAQRALTAMVAKERAARDELVKKFEADKDQYEALVDALEAESNALTRELQRLEEEARRANTPQPTANSNGWVWPTAGRAGSPFGWRVHPIFRTRRMHTGVDIGGRMGQAIVAANDGRVISTGWRGGYGLATVIDHGGGIATLYAHQSRILVSPGQWVSAGQKIGEVGSTGNSTGPHLHFEVRVHGSPRNPMEWY